MDVDGRKHVDTYVQYHTNPKVEKQEALLRPLIGHRGHRSSTSVQFCHEHNNIYALFIPKSKFFFSFISFLTPGLLQFIIDYQWSSSLSANSFVPVQ